MRFAGFGAQDGAEFASAAFGEREAAGGWLEALVEFIVRLRHLIVGEEKIGISRDRLGEQLDRFD